ncbi:hypothetical protein LCGC14_2916620 [marine sediment metagenome]|uniref:Uncharacterized protein n=1 Tax=marine sediment metagenome TaxID=412755 RepID=A0A0F8XQB5_9ZZZZ
MQYGKFGTDQAERNFRTWAAYEWAKHIKEKKNMKQLYWVAVLYRRGKKTEVLLYPDAELYENEAEAKKEAIKKIPSSYKERFDRLEVVVRPF